MIRAIEEDSQNNIWIGTLGRGLTKMNNSKNVFTRFDSRNMGLSEDVVTSIFEDQYQNLWVGTWGGGLNKIRFKSSSNNSIR